MSVLNQVLRDLEQRQAPARPELALAAIDAPPSPLLAALAPPVSPLAEPPAPSPLAALAQSALAQQAVTGTAPSRVPGGRVRTIVWTLVFACVAVTTAALEWAERQQVARAPVPLGAGTYAGALATGSASTAASNAAPIAAPIAAPNAAPIAAPISAPISAPIPAPIAATVSLPASPSASSPAAVDARATQPTRSAPPGPPPVAPRQVTATTRLAATATADRAAATPPAALGPAAGDSAPAVRRSASSEADPQADLARAATLIARGRATEAKELLTALLARQPAHVDARATLAALQAEAGDRRAALATLLAGASLDPQRFALPAAQLQNELGDTAGARQTLERVPTARRSGAQHALAAGLALAAQQPAAAIAAYQRALVTDDANAVWWVGLALAHEADGNALAAREAFARAGRSPALDADLRAFVAQRLAALPATARTTAGDAPVATFNPR
jgi:hypothetical protein